MFTTPEDWALVAREMFSTASDARAQFADFDRLVAQELTDKCAWNDLEGFYAEAALGNLKPGEYEKVSSGTTATFEASVMTMLRDALARAHRDRQVKAVYVEYAMDAENRCRLAAHLCTAFSAEDEQWVSNADVRKASIQSLETPEVFPGVATTRKDTLASNVCQAYVNARLLAAWGRAVQALNPALPLAFGRERLPVVRLMPQIHKKAAAMAA